ncbi:hypothetical protein JHK84_052298 [Glycine max]|nr:hypothetical protein JHK86_052258 [Glycine max]KAG5082260.1 hypothetical protein JHK84_052298 [Glycine max]
MREGDDNAKALFRQGQSHHRHSLWLLLLTGVTTSLRRCYCDAVTAIFRQPSKKHRRRHERELEA